MSEEKLSKTRMRQLSKSIGEIEAILSNIKDDYAANPHETERRLGIQNGLYELEDRISKAYTMLRYGGINRCVYEPSRALRETMDKYQG